MREGIEKVMYKKFNELLLQHDKPSYAVAHLDYMIFVEYVDRFNALNEEQQMEVRLYMKAMELLHGKQ